MKKLAAKNKEAILLSLILLLAIFFRFWNINNIPPGLYPDEAIYANDGITSPGKVFYPENNGREGLWMNLLFVFFKIFGISATVLRIVSAIAGTLTVFGIYFLSKEIIEKYGASNISSKKTALLASFFLAVSFWHVNFSRIGFRAIMMPLILVWAFYLFFAGLKNKNGKLIASGALFGLGFYTYSTFRLLPLLILPILIFIILAEKDKKNILKRLFLYFAIPAVIIVLPLIFYFLKNPADFIGRLGPISIFSQPSPLRSFFESLGSHLLMFNLRGDGNWRHNFPNAPQIFWPVGFCFLIGFFYQFKSAFCSFKNKSWNRLFVPIFTLGWFFVFILGGVLTYEGIPHALRTIGIIPVVYILSAIGANIILNVLKNKTKSGPLTKVIIVSFSIIIIVFSYKQYFINWGKNENVAGAFAQPFVEIGNYLNSLPQETKKYVIVNEGGVPVPYPDGIPVSAQTIMFIERSKFGRTRAQYIKRESIDETNYEKGGVVVLMKDEQIIFEKLQAMFPSGTINKDYPIFSFIIN